MKLFFKIILAFLAILHVTASVSEFSSFIGKTHQHFEANDLNDHSENQGKAGHSHKHRHSDRDAEHEHSHAVHFDYKEFLTFYRFNLDSNFIEISKKIPILVSQNQSSSFQSEILRPPIKA